MPAVMNVVLSGKPLRFFYVVHLFTLMFMMGHGPPKKMPVAGKKDGMHRVVFLALLITCAWHKTQHGIIIQRN